MPLYVMRPSDPPVGADWQAEVPGQYLYDITGITANLATLGGPDLPTDVSGNGNNGTYVTGTGTRVFTPGALTGDDGLSCGVHGVGTDRSGFIIPPAAMPFTASFTIIWWSYRETLSSGSHVDVIGRDGGGTSLVNIDVTSGNRLQVFFAGGGYQAVSAAVIPEDSAWHHVAAVYDSGGPSVAMYLDGAPIVLDIDIPGPVLAAPPAHTTFALTTGDIPFQDGRVDEFAYVPAALSAGDIATLFGAAPVFAAYEAAQLALLPSVYYHLDGQNASAGGRQVAFEVTDGSDTLALIPTGFTESVALGPFAYSWQPKLAASSQTTDGLTTTVAIPKLILPAGYTVGARTLDPSGYDQWSDISIWWDSTLMDAIGRIGPYEYAPGVHLVYKQVTDGPIRVF